MADLFLIAHVAGSGFVVDCGDVDCVVDIGGIVAVPLGGSEVLGLTALRSRVVTVIDTRRALGIAGAAMASTRAIITRVDGHLYAALVESLEDVTTLSHQPLPAGLRLRGEWDAITTGVVERDGELLPVIDIKALVTGSAAAVDRAA